MDFDMELLITLVENKPVLRDKTQDCYKNRLTSHHAAWKENCTAFNEDFETLSDVEKNDFAPRNCQCGTAKPDKTIGLQAAKPSKALCVSRLNYSTTANDLVEYVVKKTELKLRVFQLRSRHYVHYNSFVVRVPQPLLETMEREDFWPKCVVFRRFRGNLPNPIPEWTTQQSHSEVSSK